MQLYTLLQALQSDFSPEKTKVHLARWNKIDHPIDVYRRGEFEEWQRWQNGHNFTQPFVVSLIQDGATTRWMFAGLFKQVGYTRHDDKPKGGFYYDLERVAAAEYLEGRLFCSSTYTKRNSYLRGQTLENDLVITELLREKISVGKFPGYKQVNISKDELDLLMRHDTESWRVALSSVKGIYLITDTETGKLYVGKADGEAGIWGRWSMYSATGHGHNKALVQELGLRAGDRQRDLRFSLLEIADLQSAPGEIGRREEHWKSILMSRKTGLNRN